MYNIKRRRSPITNNKEIAETFNKFFINIVPNFNIDNNHGDNITHPNITDSTFYAIKNIKIRNKMSEESHRFCLDLLIGKNIQ